MALTLIESMLELAKMTGIVYEGVSTGGSTLSLVDANNPINSEEFAGGTIWILSGTYTGACKEILQSADKTFTWSTALAGVITTGISYALATNKFTRQQLKQAINFVLGRTEVSDKDESLSVENVDEYDLPEGVKNVKKVFIASNTAEPYGWIENNNWRELPGILSFQAGQQPSDTGKTIRLLYMRKHEPLAENESLDENLNEDYLLWSAARYLWRQRIGLYGKDDPEAYDFFNEATQEVANELIKGKSVRIDKAVRHSGF